MALAGSHIALLLELKKQGVACTQGQPSMLEFGEQNWFGDVAPTQIHGVIDMYVKDAGKAAELHEQVDQAISRIKMTGLFDLAKIFYKIIFDYCDYKSIDMHGTEASVYHDLNHPLEGWGEFDLVTNLGTSEHIFNQYQFFKTMHDATKPGGTMIHSVPNQGCYDHGFYNYHPTFFFDLCEANKYSLLTLVYVNNSKTPNEIKSINRISYVEMAVKGQLAVNSGLLAVITKGITESVFLPPQQGYYGNSLPAELSEAWGRLPK